MSKPKAKVYPCNVEGCEVKHRKPVHAKTMHIYTDVCWL